MSEQPYTPYGPEWEAEMMKLPKAAIIDLYRKSCQSDLQPVINEISTWSDKTFGTEQRNPAILYHLREEVEELITALIAYHFEPGKVNQAKVNEEYADCFTLIVDSWAKWCRAEDNAKVLLDISRMKLNVNKLRKWHKPDTNGVCRHIKHDPNYQFETGV